MSVVKTIYSLMLSGLIRVRVSGPEVLREIGLGCLEGLEGLELNQTGFRRVIDSGFRVRIAYRLG